MRVSDPGAVKSGFLHAAQLNIVLLSPTVCVGYAGKVGPALVAIRTTDVGGGIEAVEQHFLEAHTRSDRGVDFLVGSLRPSRLVVIRDGRAAEHSSGWVGDQAAFAEYQEHYHDKSRFGPRPEFYDSPARAEDIGVAIRMGEGMDAVVHGPANVVKGEQREVVLPAGGGHATVGEAIITAGPRVEDSLFAYFHQNRASAPFGSAAGGGFSYFVLTPKQPGIAAVGIYFYEGRLGVLYAPVLLDDPERFPNVSGREFIELVRLRYGLRLRGLVA